MFSYGKLLLFLGYFILVSSKELPTTSSSIPVPAETFQCPMDVCRCGLDPRGRVKVVCDRGDMVDPIPIRAMDPLTEVLFISSPDEKSNSLTIGPIFQVIYSKLQINFKVILINLIRITTTFHYCRVLRNWRN